MSLSVNDLIGTFVHPNEQPKQFLSFQKARDLTKFFPSRDKPKVRFASFRPKKTKNLARMQEVLEDGMDTMSEELAHLRKITRDEAKELLRKREFKRTGWFNAIP